MLFGATHYNEYHFLWTLSDTIGFEGIEHHQSSDDRSPERSLISDELRHSGRIATLLPHEYVHSWNGKFRRPAGLATGNYDTPMRGDLLWVYEGPDGIFGARVGRPQRDVLRNRRARGLGRTSRPDCRPARGATGAPWQIPPRVHPSVTASRRSGANARATSISTTSPQCCGWRPTC